MQPQAFKQHLDRGDIPFSFPIDTTPWTCGKLQEKCSTGQRIVCAVFQRLNTITVVGCEMIYRSVVGFHLCLHIQGCFHTCRTITETPSILVCSSPGRADHTYLDTVAQTACCQMVHFLFYSTDWSQVIVYMTTRLGAVAFTVLWCKWSTYMLRTPRTVMQGWGCNQCDSIQVTINGATSRCQGACHLCLPNTLASYMFWSPPIRCTIEVAALLVVAEEAALMSPGA